MLQSGHPSVRTTSPLKKLDARSPITTLSTTLIFRARLHLARLPRLRPCFMAVVLHPRQLRRPVRRRLGRHDLPSIGSRCPPSLPAFLCPSQRNLPSPPITTWSSSSILGSSGAWSSVGLADVTSHRQSPPSSTAVRPFPHSELRCMEEM